MTSPLLYCSVIQGLTFACDIKRALTLSKPWRRQVLYFGSCFHVWMWSFCNVHPPSFLSERGGQDHKGFHLGVHLRVREVMLSPHGIVGVYPLGP